jgi:hypothetical protein
MITKGGQDVPVQDSAIQRGGAWLQQPRVHPSIGAFRQCGRLAGYFGSPPVLGRYPVWGFGEPTLLAQPRDRVILSLEGRRGIVHLKTGPV